MAITDPAELAVFPRRLRQLRDDWSRRNGRRLTSERLAAALGVAPCTVVRWESGSQQPYDCHLEALCGFFGVTRLELGLGVEPAGPGRQERVSGREAGSSQAELLAMTRGALLASRSDDAGGTTDGPCDGALGAENAGVKGRVTMAVRRALRFAAKVEGSNVGTETLTQIQDSMQRLALTYPQEPLGVLLGDLVELQDLTFTLLEGHQRPEQTRDLYLLAGIASGMLAKASHDLGDPHSALAQARTAYVCADNAGHSGLCAWVRGLQSLVAHWAGWMHRAVEYAQLGTEKAAGAGTVTAWLPALEARAHAALGDQAAALAALDRAAEAREQRTEDDLDRLGGILTFAPPRQLYYAADATSWLPGEEARTEHQAQAALDAYAVAAPGERSFSDEAGAQCDLAVSRTSLGDLEGATAALEPVLSLTPGLRIHGIVASVQRVQTALRAPQLHGSAAARRAQEEVEDFCQAPAAVATALLR